MKPKGWGNEVRPSDQGGEPEGLVDRPRWSKGFGGQRWSQGIITHRQSWRTGSSRHCSIGAESTEGEEMNGTRKTDTEELDGLLRGGGGGGNGKT